MAKLATESVAEVAVRFEQIESLQAQVKVHLDAIGDLYGKIAAMAGGPAPRGRGRRGPVPGARPRAPRGALKAAIEKLLAGGKLLGPSEVVKALPKAGYKGSPDPKIFYNTVYLALKNNKNIERTKDGKFKLK
jgi:hypothetical protein